LVHPKHPGYCGPLDETDPAKTRCLVMLVARLNSMLINTHPELRVASEKGLVDTVYFKESMMFRERIGLLLESSLRFAFSSRQHRLATTIIECVTMFKIGIPSSNNPQLLQWFSQNIQRQYGPGVKPALKVTHAKVHTPNETTVAVNDEAELEINFDRTHAKAFLAQKLAICKQRNLEPKQFLSTYKEGWWIVLTAINQNEIVNPPDDFSHALEAASARRMGQPVPEKKKPMMIERMVLGFPMILNDVGREKISLKAKFKAPPNPGLYFFYAKIKSQEFIGCDCMAKIGVKVLSKAEAEALSKKEEEESDCDADPEVKKDK